MSLNGHCLIWSHYQSVDPPGRNSRKVLLQHLMQAIQAPWYRAQCMRPRMVVCTCIGSASFVSGWIWCIGGRDNVGVYVPFSCAIHPISVDAQLCSQAVCCRRGRSHEVHAASCSVCLVPAHLPLPRHERRGGWVLATPPGMHGCCCMCSSSAWS